jgi:hypothetical protein
MIDPVLLLLQRTMTATHGSKKAEVAFCDDMQIS